MVSVRDCDDAVLAAACGLRALEAGALYHRQGRVTRLTVAENGRLVSARVQGNERQPYSQSIAIAGGAQPLIKGDCSCPVGFNCKHVAAALVAARHSWRGAEIGEPDGAPSPGATPGPGASGAKAPPGAAPVPAVRAELPPVADALPYDLSAWLGELGLAEQAGSEDYPAEVPHRLVYLLSGRAIHDRHPVLIAWAVKARRLKAGGYGSDARAFDFAAMSLTPPKFVRPSDQAIAAQLGRLPRDHSGGTAHVLTGPNAPEALALLLATGRAHWQTIGGPVLALGPPRAGTIAWRLGEDTRLRPVLALDGEGETATPPTLLNANPPAWVDPAAGLIGPVETGLAAAVAVALLRAPPIAPGDTIATADAIRKRGGAVAALAPPPARMEATLTGPPRPVLRLRAATLPREVPAGMTMPYDWHWQHPHEIVGVARVVFDYDGVVIAAEDRRSRPVLTRRGALVQVERDEAAEAARLVRLAGIGLAPVAKARPAAVRGHDKTVGTALVPLDGDEGWLDFLWHDKAALEDEGWTIETGSDFPVRLAVARDPLDAELRQGSGIDWLELDLGVMLDGERIDLVPALAALILSPAFEATLASLDADDADPPFYLPLPDGRTLALPAARVKPVLATLAGLLLHQREGKPRLTAADAVALDALEQAGVSFRGGEKLRALGRRLRDAGGIPDVVPPPWFSASLRPYQARGLAWLQLLAEAGLGGVLADDMGLGKTVQTLAHIAVEKAQGRLGRPALVIAPTSLVATWTREAARFAPELSVLVLHGLDRRKDFARIGEADLVVTTYPLIARDHELLGKHDWRMLVLDEAQAIKNPDATTTKLIANLAADQRLCLSGTPLENHLGELWSLFHFANPGFLGDRKSFTGVYRNPIEKKGDRERSRLLARRVAPFMLRRTKEEVAPELPPKTEMTETIELGSAQRDVYETIRVAMHETVKLAIAARGFGQSRIVILDALLKLRQAVCDPRLLKFGQAGSAGGAGKTDGRAKAVAKGAARGAAGTAARKAVASRAIASKPVRETAPAGSAKLERLMEMLDELLSEGRRILVFSQFTSMLALIEERLNARGIAYALLTGESRNRPAIIARFQDGEVPVFLVSLKAGGTGLNLTAADTVILYDPWWNPAVEDQAIDRAHRIGQDKPVFVHRLVASDTIEEKMEVLKERKRALSEGIFDADGMPTLAMTESDIELLLG